MMKSHGYYEKKNAPLRLEAGRLELFPLKPFLGGSEKTTKEQQKEISPCKR